MSSKLKARKKKMQPEGYSVKRLENMRDMAQKVSNTEILIIEAYKNTRLIAYQILHDKFGFGQKRITRVEYTINMYAESAEKGKLSTEDLRFLLLEKYGIDVKAEANKVPFRERFALTTQKINAESKQSGGLYLGWVRYYINTWSRYKQFELKMEDIADTMAEECKYYDDRFMERFKQKGLI